MKRSVGGDGDMDGGGGGGGRRIRENRWRKGTVFYISFGPRAFLSPCNQQSRLRLVAFDAVAAPETETLFCLQFVQRTLPAYVSFVSSSPKFSMKIAVYQAKT